MAKKTTTTTSGITVGSWTPEGGTIVSSAPVVGGKRLKLVTPKPPEVQEVPAKKTRKKKTPQVDSDITSPLGMAPKKATKKAPKRKPKADVIADVEAANARFEPDPSLCKHCGGVPDPNFVPPKKAPSKSSARKQVLDAYSVGTFVRWLGIVKGRDFDQVCTILDGEGCRTLQDVSIKWEMKETRRPPADVSAEHEKYLMKTYKAAFK